MAARQFHGGFETGQSPGYPPAPGSTYRGVVLEPDDERLLGYLSPGQRAVLRAKGSYQEMAVELQIPVGTVRSRLSRARAALMKLRAEHETNRETGPESSALS